MNDRCLEMQKKKKTGTGTFYLLCSFFMLYSATPSSPKTAWGGWTGKEKATAEEIEER